MVKVVRIAAHGGPEVLAIEERAVPPPGPGEVTIAQKAIGLNYIDVYFRTGLYPAPAMPFTPGNEAAGLVTALGPGVSGLRVGDRVAYVGQLGAYAAARNIAAAALVKIPAEISFEAAAAMMLKGLTAEYLLFRTFRVKKGHVVLVHAAAGGTGQILTQWARALGATVIGTVGSEEKAAIARAQGCHHVINYATENFVERVRAVTEGALCHVVYDGVGKATFPGSLDCLRKFGMFVSFGNASGAVEAFNLGLLAGKGSLYATRPTLFTHIADRRTYAAMARRLFAAVAAGTLAIPASNRFPLDQVAEAHRALEARLTTGSTILVP
ncbi:quinone oxidoreductase family protein [Rhabdaerophilum calidifontis]|uniref:quinone oxidoreductase family protein n=1 Tax=Rhabdaerophilum calidifontis TaxID=2604328 RepID=UPI0012398C79|nr:quinone oxidoreductase [Rhabdaerophilum calidifontis]